MPFRDHILSYAKHYNAIVKANWSTKLYQSLAMTSAHLHGITYAILIRPLHLPCNWELHLQSQLLAS
jgi:hypothetical protein